MDERTSEFWDDLRTVLLQTVDRPHGRRFSGAAFNVWLDEISTKIPSAMPPVNPDDVYAAIWSLVRQGLVYMNSRQAETKDWAFSLTSSGKAAAQDLESNPDNSTKYMQRLASQVPDASPIVMQYAREALTSYSNLCYLACAVMLGVASEAAFLEMARAFANWLPSKEGVKLRSDLDGRNTFAKQFDSFRSRMVTHKNELPGELIDGMTLTLDAILDLLRINRNDAGHPTGRRLDRADAFINLQMFARYLEKMYRLRAFFEGGASTHATAPFSQ